MAGYIRSHSHVQHENLVTFSDFRLSQGSVGIYCRLGGNLCDMYIENFLTSGKRILKIGPHLPKLLSNIKGLSFLEHGDIYTVFQKYQAP